MRIYQAAQDVLHMKSFYGPILLVPESLAKTQAMSQTTPGKWQAAFKDWLSQQIDPLKVQPVVIPLGRTFLQYPVALEEEEFVISFGKLLNFHSEIRQLAVMTLLKLTQSFDIKLAPSQPILKNCFFGVHISTIQDEEEADSSKVDLKLQQYPAQLNLYLEQALRSRLSHIYVSSDHGTDLVNFIVDAKALNFTVTTKFDLLNGWYRENLMDLTPDQRSMIDFLVHSKASQFAGVGHSTFA